MQPIPGIDVEVKEGFLERLQQHHEMIVNFSLEVRKKGTDTGACKITDEFIELCKQHASTYPFTSNEEKEFLYEWGAYMTTISKRYGIPAGRVVAQYLLNEAMMNTWEQEQDPPADTPRNQAPAKLPPFIFGMLTGYSFLEMLALL